MRAQTNLVKRGSVFYFRKKVPASLRAHYGQESIRKSLRTFTTLVDARREAGRLASLYEAEFQALEAGAGEPLVPLELHMVPSLVAAFEATTLMADDVERGRGFSEESFANMRSDAGAELVRMQAAYARGDLSPIKEAGADVLHMAGIDGTADAVALRTLQRELLKARIRGLQAISQRNEGEPVPTPEVPQGHALNDALNAEEADEGPEFDTLNRGLRSALAVTTSASPRPRGKGAHRLADVVTYWKGASPKALRTTAAADALVTEFEALHGALALADITKGHFVSLRDKMLARVKPATVQSRFNLLKAAFTVCLEDDQFGITANPLQFVKVRSAEPDAKPRDAFSVEQLQTLFDSGVFAKGERPEGGRGDAAFWAPLIALYTGARLDEILSLRTDGIYLCESEPVFHFRHRPDLGQTLKGRAKNNRRVPVHPELVRLGLLGYLDAVKGRGDWLFPDIDRTEKRRSHSSAWGAWFGRHLARCNVKTDTLTFHSFRHTFKDAARACDIPEDHHDALTGHSTAEVARRYGSAEGYPVPALVRSMQRLRFGALDLSKCVATAGPYCG